MKSDVILIILLLLRTFHLCVMSDCIKKSYFWPVWQTEEVVAEEAKWLCHGKQGKHPGEIHPMKIDAWDVTLQYHTEESEDPIATLCTVTSAGRDGEFGTDDDIIGENINYHKTKIISKWAGSKAKDAISGFTEGVKESLTVD